MSQHSSSAKLDDNECLGNSSDKYAASNSNSSNNYKPDAFNVDNVTKKVIDYQHWKLFNV